MAKVVSTVSTNQVVKTCPASAGLLRSLKPFQGWRHPATAQGLNMPQATQAVSRAWIILDLEVPRETLVILVDGLDC